VAKNLSKKSVRQIRAKLQQEKPTAQALLAAGDMEPPVSQATFVAVWQAVDALKKARLEAGLSLSQLATRGGLDKATLSRLEAGRHINPTIDTLSRYAMALGRGLTLSFPLLNEASKDKTRPALFG
jgi:DNA-binding XRE family transcriptional regulator